MAIEEQVEGDRCLVTDKAADCFDFHSTFSTAIVAGRDATEQRSGTAVLCDAASKVHMSVHGQVGGERSQKDNKIRTRQRNNDDVLRNSKHDGQAWSEARL